MQSSAVIGPAERQRTATRHGLLDAALKLLQDWPDRALTHESVAQLAGVAARTAYRHFPSQSDLTLALWERIRDTTGTRWPEAESEILPSLRRTFDQFEGHATLTRAAIAAAGNTGHPVHGSAEGRAAFRRSLADLLSALPAADGDQLVGACLAIYSAPFWQMLRERGQLSATDASEAAVGAMHALLDQAHRRADDHFPTQPRRPHVESDRHPER
ncbi:MAG: helix-turn-helix domain-containing protein [Gemmatimonadota bacterium]